VLSEKKCTPVGPVPTQKPVLKWAGAKTKLIPRILGLIPSGTTRLIEPFVGSAVVALNAPVARFLLSDLNPDLINLYTIIRDEPQALVRRLRLLFVPKNNTREAFDKLRAGYNERNLPPVERAAVFVYLNRHAFNGLCRYNKSGGFNVPFGKIANPQFSEENIDYTTSVLQRAHLVCGDFDKPMAEARKGDFIYCDPPYSPLSLTASFTAYATGGNFDHAKQLQLVAAAKKAVRAGATVAISNHDTAETRELYRDATSIDSFPVRRSISGNGSSRGMVLELIALYRPRAK
jgi:DNA adenine methylase